MDNELQVSGGGLGAEAVRRAALAGELAGNAAPTGAGSAWLASQAAVGASHALVAAAGDRCVARIQATAVALDTAASGYAENEVRSAALLRVC